MPPSMPQAIGGFTALFLSLIAAYIPAGLAPAIYLGLVLLLLIPVSQLAIEVVNYLITRLLPPRPCPRWILRIPEFPMHSAPWWSCR